jgi:hypothetical protein
VSIAQANKYKRGMLGTIVSGLLFIGNVTAQTELPFAASRDISAESSARSQAFSFNRNTSVQPLSDGTVAEVVNFNFGFNYSPVDGLDLRADAWQLQPETVLNLQLPIERAMNSGSRLFIEDAVDSSIERPFADITGSGQIQGIDLSASYVWESPRFGQFIVSTKASYVYDQKHFDRLREASLTPLNESPIPVLGSEIQSSLTLTWQVGNHTASAVTHYTDKFDDIGRINVEELNELVGNLTTLDLQYGYTLKAGRQGNAVISVGLRSVLDRRAGQLPDVNPAIEKTGRMAYGTIKYQF